MGRTTWRRTSTWRSFRSRRCPSPTTWPRPTRSPPYSSATAPGSSASCAGGLVPSWAKDARGAARLINARRDSIERKPAFRAAYQRRRCLLPADGYYEWQPDGTGKQPYFLSARDGSPLAMAGLYEVWAPPEGERLWSCTVVTTEAADELGHIHDRTPLLVRRQGWARWLDPAVPDPGDLLLPGTSGVLDAWPVSPAVGNVRNDGPELAQPFGPPSTGTLF